MKKKGLGSFLEKVTTIDGVKTKTKLVRKQNTHVTL